MNENRNKILEILEDERKKKNDDFWLNEQKFLISTEISEKLHIPYPTTRYHLERLIKEKIIKRKKQGGQYLYYIE